MTNALWCWWTTFFFGNYVKGSIQSNSCQIFASKSSVPIVNFCENNQGGNEAVLIMDGSFAESIPTVASCSCVITTSHATTLYFTHNSLVSLDITLGCGSEIRVNDNKKAGILMECIVQGSIQIRTDEYLNAVLTKNKNANTKYCVYIYQGNGNARINVTCSNSSDAIVTSTSTTHVTQYSTEQISISTQILTEETSTKTQFADPSTSRTSATQSSTSTDNNMIMYYAIGGGGVVVVILVVVTVVLCRRCSSKKSQKNEKSDEDEADELQYNVLYVAADNTDIDTNTVDQHGLSHNPDTEVTYSTVDIEETERSNDKHLNQNYDFPNIKTKILPATLITPKCLESESENNATVQKSSVTHVTAPGGGSEYAVVNKQEKNNVTDSVGNTYAVVNKTWK